MAVLGPGRVSIGFPEPVGSILAEYEPEPTHLDPIRCPNRLFVPLLGFLFPPQISTWATFCFSPFSPTVPLLIFVDLFHEMRHPKLVCLLSGRGPGRLWEASYVQISFKTLSGRLFSAWGPERLLYLKNIRNYMVSFKSCVPDAMPAGAFWELEIWLFDFFKPSVPGVVPAAAFLELDNLLFGFCDVYFLQKKR